MVNNEMLKATSGRDTGDAVGLSDSSAVVIPFDPSKLDKYFRCVERKEEANNKIQSFALNDHKTGSLIAKLTWLPRNELRIYIDNFPSQKLYYSTNFPIRTVEEFQHEMARIRLKFVEV